MPCERTDLLDLLLEILNFSNHDVFGTADDVWIVLKRGEDLGR